MDKNNKPYSTETQSACYVLYGEAKINRYLDVLKFIPPIYCGDGKCSTKESDTRSFMYCRKDCSKSQSIVNDSDVSVKPKNNYYDIPQDFYLPTSKSEYLKYTSFEKAGNYSFDYNLYATNEQTNVSHLIGKATCNIKVVDFPTPGQYMRMFLTYDTPTKSKINCPKNFYLVEPSTKELKYFTSQATIFKNVVPQLSIYPYRDLDGGFISFD
ncbi:MAG TPA: hypothetical protein P5052_01530 [Candidatus Paceibacterota bacterium]|nr:hypothetical protein [Candidatus Paceibacterota bacterium]